MNSISTHLDDLLVVLRVAADLCPATSSAADLRIQLASRLRVDRADLAAVIRGLDDWHSEVLADFIADAHVVAAALDYPRARPDRADDTRVG